MSWWSQASMGLVPGIPGNPVGIPLALSHWMKIQWKKYKYCYHEWWMSGNNSDKAIHCMHSLLHMLSVATVFFLLQAEEDICVPSLDEHQSAVSWNRGWQHLFTGHQLFWTARVCDLPGCGDAEVQWDPCLTNSYVVGPCEKQLKVMIINGVQIS